MERKVYRNNYIDGNVVRKIAPIPKKRNENSRRNKKKIDVRQNQLNLRVTLTIGIVMAMMMFLCLSYLKLHSDINEKYRDIKILENQLENIRTDNNIMESDLKKSTNLNFVYKEATERLGMRYPNISQIQLYKNEGYDYMGQYERIPN